MCCSASTPPPDLPAEVERIANITDGVIRSLVVCKDE